MRVLLSNDDGVHAPGLAALTAAFPGDEVWVVAPDREQSASSHSISLHRPLRVDEVGERRFAVDGTPTDAVYMGMNLVLKGRRPDVVVSGVNHGAEPRRTTCSTPGRSPPRWRGRCSAATRSRSRSPAPRHTSSSTRPDSPRRWRTPSCAGAPPAPVLLNVNVPPGPVRGYRFARLGRRTYGNEVVENTDPRGRKYYWIGGEGAVNEDVPHSDCNCVFQDGLVSVTPLHLDWTHEALLAQMKSWTLDGYVKEPSL